MALQVELLERIVELLTVIAEPQLAQRDETRRKTLVSLVGGSAPKANAFKLMDGTRAQTTISKKVRIHPGALSRFVKALKHAELLSSEEGAPRLSIILPNNFWKGLETSG